MNGGKYPETIALVLWGTDNIKTYGESLAQVGEGSPPPFISFMCHCIFVMLSVDPCMINVLNVGCRASACKPCT